MVLSFSEHQTTLPFSFNTPPLPRLNFIYLLLVFPLPEILKASSTQLPTQVLLTVQTDSQGLEYAMPSAI